jgi:aminoglycoside phosphotransferase (APT) family kinase protein
LSQEGTLITDRISAYTRCIQRVYPELAIHAAYLNQDGQYNDVLVVNPDQALAQEQAWVFRFAKYPASLQTLRRETTILNSIREHITLAIPNPVYHNLDTEVIGEAFVGYPMIPGKPLWHELYQTIDDPTRLEQIACQLATFLRELHAIPVENRTLPSFPNWWSWPKRRMETWSPTATSGTCPPINSLPSSRSPPNPMTFHASSPTLVLHTTPW